MKGNTNMKTTKSSLYARLLFLSFLAACSAKNLEVRAPGADKVLFTSNGEDNIPKWVYLEPFSKNGDQVYVAGVVDIAGDQSPSRGLNAADLQARSELAKIIQTRLSSKIQYANEDFGYDRQLLHQIISQASKLEHLGEVHIKERGYAKVLIDNGYEKDVRYTCYSRAAVNAATLKRMVMRAFRESEKGGEISPSFRKKVEEDWDQFFNEIPAAKQSKALSQADSTAKEDQE